MKMNSLMNSGDYLMDRRFSDVVFGWRLCGQRGRQNKAMKGVYHVMIVRITTLGRTQLQARP